MIDPSLLKLWNEVRQDFAHARALLPTTSAESVNKLADLDCWLKHNELELALDTLEDLGEEVSAPLPFWQALASAAKRMGLTNHLARISKRLG